MFPNNFFLLTTYRIGWIQLLYIVYDSMECYGYGPFGPGPGSLSPRIDPIRLQLGTVPAYDSTGGQITITTVINRKTLSNFYTIFGEIEEDSTFATRQKT